MNARQNTRRMTGDIGVFVNIIFSKHRTEHPEEALSEPEITKESYPGYGVVCVDWHRAAHPETMMCMMVGVYIDRTSMTQYKIHSTVGARRPGTEIEPLVFEPDIFVGLEPNEDDCQAIYEYIARLLEKLLAATAPVVSEKKED